MIGPWQFEKVWQESKMVYKEGQGNAHFKLQTYNTAVQQIIAQSRAKGHVYPLHVSPPLRE